MSDHPIEGLMATAMQKIKEMVDVNTIIGEPVRVSPDMAIIPVSRVSLGFASGGSDFAGKKESANLFGGGAGAGMTIVPVGFLVVKAGEVKLLQLRETGGVADAIITGAPDLIETIKKAFSKEGKE